MCGRAHRLGGRRSTSRGSHWSSYHWSGRYGLGTGSPHPVSNCYCFISEQPTVPSSPTNLRVTMVTAHSLVLKWNPPDFSGNLPLTGYVVEVLLLGTSLCPRSEPEWEEYQIVEEPTATEVVVTDLVAYQKYQVRIRARNSAFRSDPSSSSSSLMTEQAGKETDRCHPPLC